MAKDRSSSTTRHHMMNAQQQAIWSDRLNRFVEFETDPNSAPSRSDHEPLERRASGRAQEYLLARARRKFDEASQQQQQQPQQQQQQLRQPPKPELPLPSSPSCRRPISSINGGRSPIKPASQRPWRVDNYLKQRGATSAIGRNSSHWKQQLQERKAIFGTVAVPEDDLSTGHMTDEDEQDSNNTPKESEESESSYDDDPYNHNFLMRNRRVGMAVDDEKKEEEDEEDLDQLTRMLKRRLVLRDLETALAKVYTGDHACIVSYGKASLTDQLNMSLYGIPKRNSIVTDRDVYQQMRRSLVVEQLQSGFVADDDDDDNRNIDDDSDGGESDEDSFGVLAPLHSSSEKSVEEQAMELAMGDCGGVKRTPSPDVAEEARALLAGGEPSAQALTTAGISEIDKVPETRVPKGSTKSATDDTDVAPGSDVHQSPENNDDNHDEQSCYSEYTISDDEGEASPNDRRSTIKMSNTTTRGLMLNTNTPVDRRSTIKFSNLPKQQGQSLEKALAASRDDDDDDDDGCSYAEYTVQDAHESDDQSYMEYTVGGDQSYMDVTVQEDAPQQAHNTMSVTKSTLKLLKSRMFSDTPLSLDVPKAASGDDASYAEYTVADTTVQQSQSDDQSYLECTVYEEHTVQDNQSYMEVTVQENAQQIPSQRQGAADSGSAASFADIQDLPTITLHRGCDDDDMTQLTFDDDFGGFDDDRSFSGGNHGAEQQPQWEDDKEATCQTTATPTTYNTQPSDTSRSEISTASTKASSHFSESSRERVASILRDDIWSKNSSTVQACLSTLAKEAALGRRHRENIGRLGGSLAILRVMEANFEDESIQIAACQCLEQLAKDDPDHPVGEVGGIPAIVEAMKNHSGLIQVQDAACKALMRITGAHNVILSAQGAVRALCAAMAAYPDHTEIQCNAFVSLGNLCVDHPQRLQELVQAGGITSMTHALQKPWSSSCKQHEAISTLSILLRCLAGQQESERDLFSRKSDAGSSCSGRRSESQSMGDREQDSYPPSNATSDEYDEVTVHTEVEETTLASNPDSPPFVQAASQEVTDGTSPKSGASEAELLRRKEAIEGVFPTGGREEEEDILGHEGPCPIQ